MLCGQIFVKLYLLQLVIQQKPCGMLSIFIWLIFLTRNVKEHQVEEVMWAENGRTTLYKKNGRLYLITDRPEFRVLQPHVDCIIDMIERNK